MGGGGEVGPMLLIWSGYAQGLYFFDFVWGNLLSFSGSFHLALGGLLWEKHLPFVENFTSIKSLMMLLSGISTLLQGFTIVSWLLLLCLSIPSLPWLATVKFAILELRTGHGGGSLFFTNKKWKASIPRSPTGPAWFQKDVILCTSAFKRHFPALSANILFHWQPRMALLLLLFNCKVVSNSATPWQRARCYPPLHTIILDFGAPFHLALGNGKNLLLPLQRQWIACHFMSNLCREGFDPSESDLLEALS